MAIRTIKVCDLCGEEQEHNTYWGEAFAEMKLTAPVGGLGANSYTFEGLICQECATELNHVWQQFKAERGLTNG